MIERVRRQVKILTWQDEWLRLTRQLTNFATNSRIESHWPAFFHFQTRIYVVIESLSKIKILQTETETEEIGNGVSERKGDEIESENENQEGVTGELHRFRSL